MDSAFAMMLMLVLFVPGSAVTNQQPPCGSGPGETSCPSALDKPKSSGLLQSHASKSHMFVSEEKEDHSRREEYDPKAHNAHSGDGPHIDVLLSEKQEGRQALRDGNGLNADFSHEGDRLDDGEMNLDKVDQFNVDQAGRRRSNPSQASLEVVGAMTSSRALLIHRAAAAKATASSGSTDTTALCSNQDAYKTVEKAMTYFETSCEKMGYTPQLCESLAAAEFEKFLGNTSAEWAPDELFCKSVVDLILAHHAHQEELAMQGRDPSLLDKTVVGKGTGITLQAGRRRSNPSQACLQSGTSVRVNAKECWGVRSVLRRDWNCDTECATLTKDVCQGVGEVWMTFNKERSVYGYADLEACEACIVPGTTGYNFDSAGGVITIQNFSPSGVVCASGYSGHVSYTVCSSASTSYSVSGCQASDCPPRYPKCHVASGNCVTNGGWIHGYDAAGTACTSDYQAR